MGLVSLSLTLRALGPSEFGRLVLIQTIALLVIALVNTHSWQTLIRYGSEARGSNDLTKLRQVIKLCGLLDLGSAIGGFLIFLAVVSGGVALGFWPRELAWAGLAYSLAPLANITGMSTGLLRIEGRFRALALHQLVAAGVRLTAIGTAFLLEGGFAAFLWVWVFSEVVQSALLLGFGLYSLGYREFLATTRQSLGRIRERCEGLIGFVVTTSLNGVTTGVVFQLDVLLVGGMIGETAAGFFRILKTLAGSVTRLAEPLRQVVYPEIARLVSEGRRSDLTDYLIRLGGVLFCLGIVAFGGLSILGPWVIPLITGPTDVSLYIPALWYVGGALIGLWVLPVMPLFLALGWHRRLFFLYQGTAWLYIGLLMLGTSVAGLIGAAVAFPVFYAAFAVIAALILWSGGDVSMVDRPSTRSSDRIQPEVT